MSYVIPNLDIDLYPQSVSNSQKQDENVYQIPDVDIDIPINKDFKSPRRIKQAETFQPNVEFDINSILPQIADLFKSKFNRNLSYKLGETSLHKKLNLDHRNSADLKVNPDSEEGQFLLNYFRENNIPFRASRGRETNSKGKTVSTGVHIHLGKLSHYLDTNQAIDTSSNVDEDNYNIPDLNIDIPNIANYKIPDNTNIDIPDGTDLQFLSSEDESLESQTPQIPLDYESEPKLVKEDFKKLGLDDVTTNIGGTEVFNPIKMYASLGKANPEKAAYYLQLLKQGKAAVIKNKNPDRPLKPAEVNVVSRNKEVPSNDEIIETYLFQYNPELIEVNRKFKSETGKDLIGIQLGEHPYTYKDGMYSYLFQPDASVIRQLNAYAKNGMEGYKNETDNITKEREAYINEKTSIENFFKDGGKDRAYLKGFESVSGSIAANILENITTPEEREQLVTGVVDDFTLGNLQLAHNVEMLGRAVNISATKGMESKEYLDLMNEDGRRQYNIEQARALLPNARFDAKTNKYLYTDSNGEREISRFEYGKLVTSRGIGSAISSTPKMLAVGRGLPFLVFLENAHLGVPEATKQAFAMIPMLAAGHLVGGLTAENVMNANYSLGSRILRNLEVRGVQGGTQALTDLVLNGGEYASGRKSLFDLAPSFSIGFAFPVGKVKKLNVGKGRTLDLKPEANLTYETEIGPNPYGVSEPLRIGNTLGKGIGAVNIEGNASELSIRHDVPISRVKTLLNYDLDNLKTLEQALNNKITKFSKRETFVYTSESATLVNPDEIRGLITRNPNAANENIRAYEADKLNISQSQKELNVINDILNQKNLSESQGIARLPIYDLALNLLNQKRALKNKTYLEKGMKLTEQNVREKNLKDNITFLETALPKEVIDLVEANEKAIRLAIGGKDLNAQLRIEHKAKLEQNKLLEAQNIKPQDKFTKSDVIKQASEPSTKGFSAIDNLARGIAHFKDEGVNNIYTKPDHANVVRESFSNNVQELVERIKNEHGAFDPRGEYIPQYERSFSKLLKDTASDLTYLAAFHIEDFYRRKVEPSITNLRERLVKDLGQEFGNLIKPEQLEDVYNKGLAYYKSNNADPFFSPLKQNVAENFPNSIKAESVKGLLEKYGTKNELDWTSGLWDFVNDKISKKEKISKDELLNVIRNGQIKVDKVILGSGLVEAESKELDLLHQKTLDDTPFTLEETNRFKELTKKRTATTRYDLKNYTSEKLELEGGRNPKEVLFKSPLKSDKYEVKKSNEGYKITEIGKDEPLEYNGQVYDQFETYNLALRDLRSLEGTNVYRGSHWGAEENVFAHFRANERETTDGKNVFHSEEFQSDWNQKGRKEGYKGLGKKVDFYTWQKELIDKRIEAAKQMNDYSELSTKESRAAAKKEFNKYSEQEHNAYQEYTKLYGGKNYETPQNPFMENHWKELSFKRFLRMGIEMGKDGVSWTTARQQQERYNKAEGYSDYDTYFVNLAKKIGKRFGAEYKIKKIDTGNKFAGISGEDVMNDLAIPDNQQNLFWQSKTQEERDSLIEAYRNKINKKIEQVHYLEITPQMRDSLLKEGQPLYGINQNEPLKPSAEFGIRNKIVTKDIWDKARANIVETLNQTLVKDEGLSGGTVLNSGLNPEAFVDQFKLLYKGYTDFKDFSKTLISQYGDKIIPHLNDLWNYIQDKAIKFNENESGSLQFWNTKNSPSTDAFFKKNFIKRFTKNPIESTLNSHLIRRTLNTVALAELNPNTFGLVFDKIRDTEGVVNSQVNSAVGYMIEASKLDPKLRDKVSEVMYIGNEEGKTYNLNELLTGDPYVNRPPLNTEQADAYLKLRDAQNVILNIRLNHELYYAHKTLSSLVPNTPEYNKQLNHIGNIIGHYKSDLIDGGYVTLKRLGSIVLEGEDVSYPVGNPKRKVYTHARNEKESKNIEDSWRGRGYQNITVTDLPSLGLDNIINMGRKLTPAEFEDLITRSGANTNDPQIQQVRELVYSRYGSHAYKLKRDFTRGYERTWDNLIQSIHAQMSVYENAFRNNIGREEAVRTLDNSGLLKSDKDLYDLALSYIEDSTKPISPTLIGRIFSTGRQAVSVMQLAGDVSQFYMNAYLQPITQTYSYFARIPEVKFGEAETYFVKAQALGHKLLGNKYTDLKTIVPKELSDLFDRGHDENLLTARMTNMIAGDPAGKMKNKFMNWAFVANRAGEVVTRTTAFTEAYLVGKEKLNLTGEDLYKFMRRAVDVTQGVGGNAENPYYIRRTGEVGKAFYQFGKFNQMWLENLGLSMKADFEALKQGGFKFSTGRHLGALGIVGGFAALPMTAFASTLYTLVTGDDPKKKFKDYMKDHELLYNLANYGTAALPAYILNTSAEGLSRKVAIPAPILDSIDQYILGIEGLVQGKGLSDISAEQLKNFPVYTTLNQIAKAPDAIRDKRYTDAIPIKSIRNTAKTGENLYNKYNNQRGNIKTPSGNRIVSADKLSYPDILLQLIGISPAKIGDYYDEQRAKRIKKSITGKAIRKFSKSITQ